MRQFTSPTSSVLYFLHSDHLGSTSLTTDSSGNVVARQLYDAWGNIRYVTGTLPTDIAYTGQRLDATGLMYFQARYYASSLGRFISADTIVPQPGNPQALNRYAYTVNNPLKYNDPSGHCFIICAIGGAIVGGLIGGIGSAVSQVVEDIQAGQPLSIDVGQVAQATGTGAVVGAVAGGTFGVGLAVGGAVAGATGITGGTAASVAGGATVALSSVASGQAARATENALSGQDIGTGLFQPGDMVKDAVLGLAGFKLFGGSFSSIVAPSVPEGIVYMRKNPSTGDSYIGQTKSPARFVARQAEHNRELGIQHDYTILGRAQPGTELDVLEESMIRAYGGLRREGGLLLNKKHVMSESRYRAASGKVDIP
jgi:RHS repeat-associated protein